MFRLGSDLVCSRSRSHAIICLLRSASSRSRRVSCHVGWGLYRPGIMGMKSFMGRPKMHCAGESLVFGSGVFRYWSIALWKASVSSEPLGLVLSWSILFTVFTPISALQFECGKATDDSLWRTPQLRKNDRVSVAVNSGPPSLASSSGTPKVTKVLRRDVIRPLLPSFARSTMGQFE